VDSNEATRLQEDSVSLVRLGQFCTLIAFAIVIVVLGGMFGPIPKFGSPSVLLVTAILFSVVGRALRRRAKTQP
jgi:hypothetical protein